MHNLLHPLSLYQGHEDAQAHANAEQGRYARFVHLLQAFVRRFRALSCQVLVRAKECHALCHVHQAMKLWDTTEVFHAGDVEVVNPVTAKCLRS